MRLAGIAMHSQTVNRMIKILIDNSFLFLIEEIIFLFWTNLKEKTTKGADRERGMESVQ